MRSVNLYYVYDNINETVVTPFIPQANDLTAALGFRDAYIIPKEKPKGIIDYRSLDLVRFAQIDTTEDGEYFINGANVNFDKVVRIQGNDIMTFIKDEMSKLGIDDNFVEDNE